MTDPSQDSATVVLSGLPDVQDLQPTTVLVAATGSTGVLSGYAVYTPIYVGSATSLDHKPLLERAEALVHPTPVPIPYTDRWAVDHALRRIGLDPPAPPPAAEDLRVRRAATLSAWLAQAFSRWKIEVGANSRAQLADDLVAALDEAGLLGPDVAVPAPQQADALCTVALRVDTEYLTRSGERIGPMYQIQRDGPSGLWYATGRRGDWFGDGRAAHAESCDDVVEVVGPISGQEKSS